MLNIYFFAISSVGDLGKTKAAVSSALNAIDLSTSGYIATEADIVAYNWTTQTITIKNGWETNAEALPAWMEAAGYFIVVFEGNRLFSGRIAQYGTHMPINYPLMLYDEIATLMNNSAELVYLFRPSSDPRIEPPFPFPADEPAVAAAVRAHLQASGKLQEG